MYISTLLLVGSLFYLVLVTLLYFSRKRIGTIDNKIYGYIIVVTFLGIIFDFYRIYNSSLVETNDILMPIVSNFHHVFLLVITCLITLYIFLSSNNNLKNKVPKKAYWIIGVYLLSIIITFILDIYFKDHNILNYSLNESFLYSVIGISMFTWLVYIIANYNIKNKKKYAPIIILILLFAPIVYIQTTYPEFLIVTAFITFVVVFMYHSIESPDIKLIKELDTAKEQAERANYIKAEFLSDLSHQIRTPLNAIVGFSQCIEAQDISDNVKDDVQNIKNASNNLLELVNKVIDVSKITLNQLEIINNEYNIGMLIDEVVTFTKERMGSKSLEFRTEFDKNLPKLLYGDYYRVKQIMINILTNAVKHTDKGYINFKIIAVRNDALCRLVMTVENSGSVSSNDDIDNMFEKYDKLNISKFQSIEETNLNLAITRRIIELMNGNMSVREEQGRGSSVTISIDQKIANTPLVKSLEDTINIDSIDLNINSKRVLIVDDNKINLKVASKLLSNYGAKTDESFSGQDCLDKIISGEQYDLILLDDMMPEMSGVETLKKLRNIKGFKTPVVALTANAIIGMKEKYLKDGFDDYISKPIERKELNKVLVKFLKLTSANASKDKTTNLDIRLLVENSVDVEKGIQVLGDITTYNEMLKDFLSEGQKKIVRIKAYLEGKDMTNYAVLAHSFKTDAKYFGFTKLSDIAYKHEIESKKGNLEYITNNYEDLNNEVSRIIVILKKYFG